MMAGTPAGSEAEWIRWAFAGCSGCVRRHPGQTRDVPEASFTWFDPCAVGGAVCRKAPEVPQLLSSAWLNPFGCEVWRASHATH